MKINRSGWSLVLGALLGLLALGAGSGAQDVGFEGPSYSGANIGPTGTKPQSKLWFTDGAWWGSLWSAGTHSFMVHRLDTGTQTWVDTGTVLDSRPTSHADCLWDGAKLYVASHRFTTGAGLTGHPLLLYRLGYDPLAQLFSLDTGFPVQVADASCETLVIEKDSTGTLWAIWDFGLRVWYAHTLGDERSWSAPAIHPASTSDVTSDDICSAVSFGGNVGVLWTDETTDSFYFSVHVDGAPGTNWSAPEVVLSGPNIANDHISLKASSDGRVFALIKTGTDENRLMVRSPGGGWSSHLVADAVDGWTRGILLLDETADEVHCFGASPILGGTIYAKVGSMTTPVFPAGLGTPVIHRADDPTHDDVTSTKQNLSGETGLVVLASHDASQHYWHHHDDLGGPVEAPPVAAFHASVEQGFAPLAVQFLDASTGLPSSWSWDFGDGSTSTEHHPRHIYSTPGLYSVSLGVANAQGSDTLVQTDLVLVETAPTALLLSALQDAQVREGSPSANYGALGALRVRDDPTSDYHAYVKFEVPATGNLVTGATLRLFVTDASPDGGSVYPVDSTWTEPGITWSNAPALVAPALGTFGQATLNTWVELDVSAAVDDDGLFSFGIANSSTNSVFYSSREGANPPELSLTLEPPVLPEADFSAVPTLGIAPLVVQFLDSSNGGPTAWSWDFGDGASSSAQNPSHVYQHPGLYTVTLEVENENGSDEHALVGFVRVLPHGKLRDPSSAIGGRGTSVSLPAAGFSADPTEGTAPLAVQFTDRSSGLPTAWSWDFGDGASSGEEDPSHVYLEAGLYTVTLGVENEYGADELTLVGYVNVLAPRLDESASAADALRHQRPLTAIGAGRDGTCELPLSLADAVLWATETLPGAGFEVRQLRTAAVGAVDYLLIRGSRTFALHLGPGPRGTRMELRPLR